MIQLTKNYNLKNGNTDNLQESGKLGSREENIKWKKHKSKGDDQ